MMRRFPILLLALIAACGTAGAAETHWRLRTSFQLRYDSNIIELSDYDIDRLHNPHPNDARRNRFSIETEDDIAAVPEVDPELTVDWLHGAPTTFGATLTAYQYQRNNIKSYQSYTVYVAQRLHRKPKYATNLTLTAGLIPYYYVRNLTDQDAAFATGIAGLRNEATYTKTAYEARVEQVVVPDHLRATVYWGEQDRDYNDDFNERDSHMPYSQIIVAWDPMDSEHLRLRFGYRHESLEATGDLEDTPLFIENDVSSLRDLWSIEARTRWGHRGRRKNLRFGYIGESRDYTTDNVFDIYHFDRHDDRHEYGVDFQADLKKGWFFTAGARHEENDSTFPATPGSTFDPDEITDYTQNIAYAGFGYSFGGGAAEFKPPPPTRESP
jgi:hypothetical protein